jgi:hypothetical protein
MESRCEGRKSCLSSPSVDSAACSGECRSAHHRVPFHAQHSGRRDEMRALARCPPDERTHAGRRDAPSSAQRRTVVACVELFGAAFSPVRFHRSRTPRLVQMEREIFSAHAALKLFNSTQWRPPSFRAGVVCIQNFQTRTSPTAPR